MKKIVCYILATILAMFYLPASAGLIFHNDSFDAGFLGASADTGDPAAFVGGCMAESPSDYSDNSTVYFSCMADRMPLVMVNNRERISNSDLHLIDDRQTWRRWYNG